MARVNKLVAATLFSLLAAAAARAEDDPKTCAAIHEDDARLECYDLMFRKAASAIPTTSAWQVRQEISKIDDSTNVVLYLDSSTDYQDRFGNPP